MKEIIKKFIVKVKMFFYFNFSFLFKEWFWQSLLPSAIVSLIIIYIQVDSTKTLEKLEEKISIENNKLQIELKRMDNNLTEELTRLEWKKFEIEKKFDLEIKAFDKIYRELVELQCFFNFKVKPNIANISSLIDKEIKLKNINEDIINISNNLYQKIILEVYKESSSKKQEVYIYNFIIENVKNLNFLSKNIEDDNLTEINIKKFYDNHNYIFRNIDISFIDSYFFKDLNENLLNIAKRIINRERMIQNDFNDYNLSKNTLLFTDFFDRFEATKKIIEKNKVFLPRELEYRIMENFKKNIFHIWNFFGKVFKLIEINEKFNNFANESFKNLKLNLSKDEYSSNKFYEDNNIFKDKVNQAKNEYKVLYLELKKLESLNMKSIELINEFREYKDELFNFERYHK